MYHISVSDENLNESSHKHQAVLLDAYLTASFGDSVYKSVKNTLLLGLLEGLEDKDYEAFAGMHFNQDIFQVIITEKYNREYASAYYDFSEMLKVGFPEGLAFDEVIADGRRCFILKGEKMINYFNRLLLVYKKSGRFQENSPFDTLFFAYGSPATSLERIHDSYMEALALLKRRFFCNPGEHVIGYDNANDYVEIHRTKQLDDNMLNKYANYFTDIVQSFNKNKLEEKLGELRSDIYLSFVSVYDVKLFLMDVFLLVKERLTHVFGTGKAFFDNNRQIMNTINQKKYLYEILKYFESQFVKAMQIVGNSSRESVLNDVIFYIDHNYMDNITLEQIAPLFGYNSSYLGKIFSKKMGTNFNAYIDSKRVERAKVLLKNGNFKVYQIAEQLGYKNVDYFHIKFRKYVGISPAEYRKQYLSEKVDDEEGKC